MRKFRFLLSLWIHPLLSAAEIELTGYVGIEEKPYFNLTDKASKTNAWVSISQTFKGYELKRFERSKGLLVLEKEGETISLRLRGSTVSTPADQLNQNRIAALEGFDLAVELARQGDDHLSDLLASYHLATDPANVGPEGKAPAEFLASRIHQLATERKRSIMATVKERAKHPAEPASANAPRLISRPARRLLAFESRSRARF